MRRRIILFIIPLIIAAGMGFFVQSYAVNCASWATSVYNRGLYNNGVLCIGELYDRNGILLSSVIDGERVFAEDEELRRAMVHATGDIQGNIAVGALKAFAEEMTGYNIFFGTRNGGGKVYLTIDSRLNKAAYNALGSYNGTVAVCNYKTGEILCMVSSPGCDPISPSAEENSGAYMNRFLSSSYTPGSVFKIVTLAAALENMPDISEHEFVCTGSVIIDGETVNCHGIHGTIKIEDAFAQSCNCAFAEIAQIIGAEKISEYADKLGLTSSIDIDGISTKAGSFTVSDKADYAAWSAIGQYKNLVNPASMLQLVSAIANGGTAPALKLISKTDESKLLTWIDSISEKSNEKVLLDNKTADDISSMMNYNVYSNYGSENFPGLELHAKSGTAEVGGGKSPHSWFVGFITNDNYPLAFVVIAENGGSGASTAGRIANAVLQSAIAGQE